MLSTIAYGTFHCSSNQETKTGAVKLLGLMSYIDIALSIIFTIIGVLAVCGILPQAVGIAFFSLAFVQVTVGAGCLKASPSIEKTLHELKQAEAELQKIRDQRKALESNKQ